MSLLAPYCPDADGPWALPQAGHLLRRAGFAPSRTELDRALADGPAATVERLLTGADQSPRARELDPLGEEIAARGEIERLAAWWLSRMVHTARPLHARVALLWHNHFASSNAKVNAPPLMLRQLRTFERCGLGRFDDLLLAVARDPAMIVWLDGDSNRKDHPNENFARELFELFSLGPGAYGERDIQEAARAFSGWHQRGGAFAFQPRLHDEGPKTVLGDRGNLDGGDVVRIAVAQPACARFIALRLLREFVSETPGAALVDETAAALRSRNFEIGSVLRVVLCSRAFYDAAAYRARIKSPVEFAVGLVRSFEMKAPGQDLQRAVAAMGQRLFQPPSVKGWEGHRRWISSAAMLVRMNAAADLCRAAPESPLFGRRVERGLDAHACVQAHRLSTAADAIDFAAAVMLNGQIDTSERARLLEACGGEPAEALRAAVAGIASGAAYHLC